MSYAGRDWSRLLQIAVDRSHCPICMAGRPFVAKEGTVGPKVTCRACHFVYVLPWPELRKRFPEGS